MHEFGSVILVGPSQLRISWVSVPARVCWNTQDVVLMAAMSPQQGHSHAGLQHQTPLGTGSCTDFSVLPVVSVLLHMHLFIVIKILMMAIA